MEEYKLGARPSPEDVRDYSVRLAPAAIAQLPKKFRRDYGKNYNQKAGNCVVQSERAIWRHVYGIEFGVDFTYGGARNGTYSGLYPSDAANFAVKYGLAPLKNDPGEREVVDVIYYYEANAGALELAAAKYKAKSWGRASTINEIKAATYSSDKHVMVTLPWYAWNTDKLGRIQNGGNLLGFHQVDIIGWEEINGIEMAVIFNSHGESFGIGGEGYAYWDHIFAVNDIIVFDIPAQKNQDTQNNDLVVVYPTLRKGMKGDYVKKAQQLLVKHGLESIVGKIDSDFGSKTEAAVMAFQKKTWPTKEKEWDGVVGRKTWDALEAEPAPTPPDPKKEHETLRLKSPYMKGPDVELCQKLLITHGFDCGKIDRTYGQQTQQAVVLFQRAKKLSPDGVVGPKSWAALEAAPTPPPAPDPLPETTVERLIAYLKGELDSIYVWGAQGENLTAMLDERGRQLPDKSAEAWIKRVETSAENAGRVTALFKKRVAEGKNPIKAYDCSGLIVRFLLDNAFIKSDMSSRGLFSACKELKRADLIPGDLVFRHNGVQIHHVGVYIGNGQVIEAKGRDDGVVLRDINASGSGYWNRYGRLPVLQW